MQASDAHDAHPASCDENQTADKRQPSENPPPRRQPHRPNIDLGEIAADPIDVPLERLKFGFSPRSQSYDKAHANLLVELLPQLPPIIVHSPSMRVIDGVHRVIAARSARQKTIRALLFHGTETEATVQAVLCNVAHGKPLTLGERQRAARNVLRAYPDWSDRRVAAVCGLSPKTVGRLRGRRIEEHSQLRLGRDGKVRPTNPTVVRQRIVQAIHENPEASTKTIAEIAGSSPNTVRDVQTRLRNGESTAPVEHRRNGHRLNGHALGRSSVDVVYRSRPDSAQFMEWFQSRLLTDPEECQGFVDAVPLSRVYEVADAARLCSDLWRRFAAAVEARASGNRP